jgi:hypothetical protein
MRMPRSTHTRSHGSGKRRLASEKAAGRSRPKKDTRLLATSADSPSPGANTI